MTNNYEFNLESYNDVKIMLSDDLENRIKILKKKFNYKDIIIVCIGSDKSIGDSYGPLVESNLMDRALPSNVSVHGVIGNTINAINISKFICEYINELNKKLVIVIDAAVSYNFNFKSITIHNGSIYPGKALKRWLPKIGDISLEGVVSNTCIALPLILMNSNEEIIKEMSNITTDAIARSLWQESIENIDKTKKYTLFKR